MAAMQTIEPGAEMPPPGYTDVQTAPGTMIPPAYNDAVDPAKFPPITEKYVKPQLEPGVAWGSYIPQGQYIVVVPQLIGGEWRWAQQNFTDPYQAKMEAIARLNRVNEFHVVEMIQWLQSLTNECYVEENTYVIHDGTSGTPLFVAKETSDACARTCMAPQHTMQIKIFLADQYGYPQYGAGPLFTIDRDGADCQGCGKCTPLPCLPCSCRKALCCFNCWDCSRNEMTMYEGDAPGYPKESKDMKIMGRAKEGTCCTEGHCMHPSISLFQGDSVDPYAIAEGPSLFGGFLQCFTNAQVPVSKIEDLDRHRRSCQSALNKGDLALMHKVRPTSCCGILKEMCTDADTYHISVTDSAASLHQRVSLMASLFMIDSMLFERDMKPIESNGGNIVLTGFECYCCGTTCPCCVTIPLRQ